MGVRTPAPDEVAARLAIMEVIHRCARALDRLDRALLLSCWHDGGTDAHPPFYAGPVDGFVAWVIPTLAAMVQTRHVVSNTVIALRGDAAGAESYWSATLRVTRDGEIVDLIRGGRYLDRLERIDGVWAFRHRHSITETSRIERVDAASREEAAASLIARGAPALADGIDPDSGAPDPSYALLGEPPPDRERVSVP